MSPSRPQLAVARPAAGEDPVGAPEAELVEAVVDAAKGLRFGSIEVVVHDGRVVQVSRTEKKRITK